MRRVGGSVAPCVKAEVISGGVGGITSEQDGGDEERELDKQHHTSDRGGICLTSEVAESGGADWL